MLALTYNKYIEIMRLWSQYLNINFDTIAQIQNPSL